MRGRKRKRNPLIPVHVDQAKLPKGLYFDARDGGAWYTLTKDAVGRQRRKNVARGDARLSDLHRIAEEAQSVGTGTVMHLCDLFRASPQFTALSDSTRKDYDYCRDVVTTWRTRVGPFGAVLVAKLSVPAIQGLIDEVAKDGPSKANHALRYLRRLFKWGIQRGHCVKNPAAGVEQAEERQRRRLPSHEVMAALVQFAFKCGHLPPKSKGSCPAYLWCVFELAYLCRLRGVEVITLTDANALDDGVRTNRRKGSRDNIVRWTPRLRLAWQALCEQRDRAWSRRSIQAPARPDLRPLVVSEDGTKLEKSSLDSAWQRLVMRAIAGGVLAADDRFSLHDLKRRGITDTPGTRADKQEASGHRSAAMMDVYDLSVPVVDPAQT